MKTSPSSPPSGKTTPRPGPARRQGGVVVPHEPRWFQRLAAWIVCGFEHTLTATLRPVWEERSGCFRPGTTPEPVIFCIWHNRLAVSMWIYRVLACRVHPERRMAAIVSASKDGALLAAILESFHVQPVRGSSSRRGSQALLELTRWAGQGYDLAITPDGPRGPRYVIQEGVMALAQFTGLPIVPVCCNFSRKWTFNSWDRFQLPQPFARCEIVTGEIVRVPREATDAQRATLRAELEKSMRSGTKD